MQFHVSQFGVSFSRRPFPRPAIFGPLFSGIAFSPPPRDFAVRHFYLVHFQSIQCQTRQMMMDMSPRVARTRRPKNLQLHLLWAAYNMSIAGLINLRCSTYCYSNNFVINVNLPSCSCHPHSVWPNLKCCFVRAICGFKPNCFATLWRVATFLRAPDSGWQLLRWLLQSDRLNELL